MQVKRQPQWKRIEKRGGRAGCDGGELFGDERRRREAGRWLAAFGEEGLEEGGAVWGEDAGGDFGLMVEAGVREDLEAGAHGATFGIVAAVHESGDASLNDGTGAHAAGLDGDVEGGVRKAVIAEDAGGLTQDDDLGVGGRVAVANGAVARASDDLGVVD